MSFRAQLAIVLCACVAMAALAFVLISDAVQTAEDRLIRDAGHQIQSALAELAGQYRDQETFRGEDFGGLPPASVEISLKGLSVTVLRSYEQVAGGFLSTAGVEGASREISDAERRLLGSLAPVALRTAIPLQIVPEGEDVITIAAQPVDPGSRAAWTTKRLAGVRNPVGQARRVWTAALVISAFLGTGGIVAIWYFYRASAIALETGLKRMESDVDFRLPAIGGDFGRIASAINRMADQRRKLEDGIRRQDRLAALGKVVAGVAHEIRNPLNSAVLTLELLNARLESGKASQAEVQSAIDEIRRLDAIVTRLLVFGKPSLSERRIQPVAPLIERAAELVRGQARHKAVSIAIDPAGELQAAVDGPQVEQVVVNLLLNAIEASAPESQVRVAIEPGDGHLAVHVDDSGRGVSERDAPHVFDAYFTTKSDGSGLGLAVSREIAELHGGSLQFTSIPGRTRFTLTLPAEHRG